MITVLSGVCGLHIEVDADGWAAIEVQRKGIGVALLYLDPLEYKRFAAAVQQKPGHDEKIVHNDKIKGQP